MKGFWKKYLTYFLIFFLASINFTSNVLAKEEMIDFSKLKGLQFEGYEQVTPNLLIFPFKQIGEKLGFYFKVTEEDKKIYQYNLLNKRYKELVYIINFKKTSFLPEVVGRYNDQIGIIKTRYKLNNFEIDEKLRNSIKILEILRDQYPANSSHWLSIQQAIDTTNSLF